MVKRKQPKKETKKDDILKVKDESPQPQQENIPLENLIEVRKRPSGHIKIGSAKDVMFWATQSLKAVQERWTKKSFLEKYGTLLAVIFLGLTVAFVSIYTLNKFVTLSNIMTSAVIESGKSAERVADTLASIQGPATPSPVLGRETPVGT